MVTHKGLRGRLVDLGQEHGLGGGFFSFRLGRDVGGRLVNLVKKQADIF